MEKNFKYAQKNIIHHGTLSSTEVFITTSLFLSWKNENPIQGNKYSQLLDNPTSSPINYPLKPVRLSNVCLSGVGLSSINCTMKNKTEGLFKL